MENFVMLNILDENQKRNKKLFFMNLQDLFDYIDLYNIKKFWYAYVSHEIYPNAKILKNF